MNIGGIVSSVQRLAVKNSPRILVGLGVASLVTCVVLAVKAAPKSKEVWTAKEYEVDDDVVYHDDPDKSRQLKNYVTKPEYAKILVRDFGPIWAPTIIAGAASLGFFLGANHIQIKRQEMLVAAYTLSEKALTTYQKKVIDKVGEKGHAEVMDSIAEDELKRNPYDAEKAIITTYGDTRFYDEWSGRYFLSDRNAVQQAENEINKRLPVEMYCSVNDFYEQLGIPTVPCGERVGWDVGDLTLDITYSPIFDSEGHPCTCIHYLAGVFESQTGVLEGRYGI